MEFAQELAIEFMDARHGPRSGAFKSHQTAGNALNACLATLVDQIGRSHNVPREEVARFFGRRSLTVDVGVYLSFILLYCFLAAMLARRLRRRYPPEDGWAAALVMVTLCSLASGVGGMLLGEQWSILAESIRVGAGHLSYRLDRLPWVRHRFGVFVLCIVLFWVAAAAQYRRLEQHACEPS
jgi:hypothetical protein